MDNSNDRFYFRAEGAWRFLAFYYCLLFDVDGTLLDFNAAEDGALRDKLAHFSLPNTEDAVSQSHDINNALWAALEQGIVQKIQAYIAPKIFGGAGAKTPVSGIGVAHPAEAVKLTLRQMETIGDDLMLRYSVD